MDRPLLFPPICGGGAKNKPFKRCCSCHSTMQVSRRYLPFSTGPLIARVLDLLNFPTVSRGVMDGRGKPPAWPVHTPPCIYIRALYKRGMKFLGSPPTQLLLSSTLGLRWLPLSFLSLSPFVLGLKERQIVRWRENLQCERISRRGY